MEWHSNDEILLEWGRNDVMTSEWWNDIENEKILIISPFLKGLGLEWEILKMFGQNLHFSSEWVGMACEWVQNDKINQNDFEIVEWHQNEMGMIECCENDSLIKVWCWNDGMTVEWWNLLEWHRNGGMISKWWNSVEMR